MSEHASLDDRDATPKRGSISQTAHTLLWSRSRGLCAICKTDLAGKIGGAERLTGFRAHITAAAPSGPRFAAEMDGRREDYSNLILLCGDCHAKVDAAPDHYTVPVLHAMKTEHELECERRLTVDDEHRRIVGEILANAVDLVVDGLSLERWNRWTAEALGPSPYRIPDWWYREFRLEVRPNVEAVLWPQSARSLEIASKMAIDAAIAFFAEFCRHTPSDDYELNRRFLAADSISKMLHRTHLKGKEFQRLERELRDWDQTLELGLVHITKCVNWFADAVREHVNPRFRITEGAFIMEPSRFVPGTFGVCVFTSTEKSRLLDQSYVYGDISSVWGIVRESWAAPPERKYELAGDDLEWE